MKIHIGVIGDFSDNFKPHAVTHDFLSHAAACSGLEVAYSWTKRAKLRSCLELPVLRVASSVLIVCTLIPRLAPAQKAPQPAPIEQLYKMPTVYSIPGMDKAQIRRDVVYKSAATEKGKVDLKFDSYAPANA